MKTLSIVLFALAALSQPAQAAEWNGFYAGVYTDQSFAGTQTKFDAGVLGGYRWALTETFVLGLEAQGGTTLNAFSPSGGPTASHAYGAASIGTVLGGNTLIFAAGAAGLEYWSWSATVIPTVRGSVGLEYALNDTMHVRGEIYAARNTVNPNTFFGMRASALFQFR